MNKDPINKISPLQICKYLAGSGSSHDHPTIMQSGNRHIVTYKTKTGLLDQETYDDIESALIAYRRATQ